jgi:hypothetical protein
MTSILIFIVAIFWGLVAGQFLIQIIASTIGLLIFLFALAFSRVSRKLNLIGFSAMFAQLILFSFLFAGGNWLSACVINYAQPTAASTASVGAFLMTMLYCGSRLPGRCLLNRLCAWQPGFFETQRDLATQDRVAFARNFRA